MQTSPFVSFLTIRSLKTGKLLNTIFLFKKKKSFKLIVL